MLTNNINYIYMYINAIGIVHIYKITFNYKYI